MTPEDEKQPLEVEAKWADLSHEPRVVPGTLYYAAGKICVALVLFALLMIVLHFDPILSKKTF